MNDVYCAFGPGSDVEVWRHRAGERGKEPPASAVKFLGVRLPD